MKIDRKLAEKTLLSLIMLGVLSGALNGVWQRYREFLNQGSLVPSFLVIVLLLIGGAVFAVLLLWLPGLLKPFNCLKQLPPSLRWFAAIAVIFLPIGLYAFHRWSEPFGSVWIRLFLIIFALTLAAWLVTPEPGIKFEAAISVCLIFSAGLMLVNQFRDVTDYPFSIGWSEGNRIWDYSVLFGRDLYNWPQDQPIPAYIDLGRQSLWGSIFLLPHVSIRMMRAWNGILFTLPYALLGWALLRRQPSLSKWVYASEVLWTMLFLNQGPIYTPLVLAAILVALGQKLPFGLNCLIALLAGMYAILSRSTWIVAPAAFAGMLTLANPRKGKPVSEKTRWVQAILIGLCALLGAVLYLKNDAIHQFLSGQPGEQAAESASAEGFADDDPRLLNDQLPAAAAEVSDETPALFTPEWIKYFLARQPLLFDRLWPNETYKPGIVLGLLTAVLPLILILTNWDRQTCPAISPLQRTALALVLIALLAAGLLISTKIGGGSNLHNLDMFLIALVILGAMAWNDGMGLWLESKIRSSHWVSWIVVAAVLLPTLPIMLSIEPKKYPAAETTEDALVQIQQMVADHENQEILFIDQRQLLTFGNVPAIPLIADYEKKWMMDEAMADNGKWFEPYHNDLKNQ